MTNVLAIGVILIFSMSFFFSDFVKALASLDLGSIDEIRENFTENLKSKVDKIVSEAVNNTKNTINSSSAIISNGSNLSSSQIVVSNNQSVLASAGQDSNVLSHIENVNGECRATKIGGSGNETLSSAGVCNDQITGGPGADKFICGEGTDTITDYNPDEGDTIADTKSCEKII